MHIVKNVAEHFLFTNTKKLKYKYLNATKLSIPLAVAKISAKIHITMAPTLK